MLSTISGDVAHLECLEWLRDKHPVAVEEAVHVGALAETEVRLPCPQPNNEDHCRCSWQAKDLLRGILLDYGKELDDQQMQLALRKKGMSPQ